MSFSSSFEHTVRGNKKRHSVHSYGGKRDDWDLTLIMDAAYSPKPVTPSSATFYVDSEGEMHDPDYRPFALPPSLPGVRKTPTEAYEEELEADRRCWLSGRAESPIRQSLPKPAVEDRWPMPAPRPRSSTTSSSSSCAAVRRALHLHRPAPQAESDDDGYYDVFYAEPASPGPQENLEEIVSSEDEDDNTPSPPTSMNVAEHLRQKMLSAHLGMQFSVIRTERRIKKNWTRTAKKVHALY
ncbi:hypothetical protein HDZ31DRAFT_35777 [Schizophyllum fasciatum]